MLGLTTFSDVSFVVQFLISLIGLGVAIDYSLLLVSRWREERAHGRDNEEAVVVAMKTAGHAVLASGVTVAISLVALVVVPVPFLRSMGIGGMLIPLVSVAVVLTLLPALLVQDRTADRLAADPQGGRRLAGLDRLGPGASSATSGSPPAAALVILGAADLPRVQPQDRHSPASTRWPRSGPPYDALQHARATAASGTGVLTPIVVLVDRGPGRRRGRRGPRGRRHPAGRGRPSDEADYAVIDVVPVDETVDSSSNEVVDDGPRPRSRGRSTARSG